MISDLDHKNNMRELKFRVWDRDAKHFCGNLKKYLLDVHTSELQVANYSDLYEEWYYSQNMDTYYTIQQYIGLKDKNGKDVYEGDIIQYNVGSSYENMNFIVQWSEDSLGYIIQSQSGDILTNSWTPDGNRFNFIELKGNVFENPELLK